MDCMSQESAEALAKITEIGRAVVDHVNSGAKVDRPLWDKHYSDNFVSAEADGMSWEGKAKVQEKHDWWNGNMTVHSCVAEGPFVTKNGFCVRYEMDMEAKDGSMPRTTMREIGVYTVNGGKVVREEFFMEPMG